MDPFHIDLISKISKSKNKINKNREIPEYKKDDNEEILRLLKARLQLGRERYGHGMRVDDDTRQFGTPDNDWELMALEELLDGLIYTTASIIRHRRKKLKIEPTYNKRETNDDMVIDYKNKKYIKF